MITEEITNIWDDLTEKQQKIAINNIKQEQNQIGKNYFNNSILPVIQDFANLTQSILDLEENDKNQTITAILKNSCSLDITGGKYFRSILFITDYIGISIKEGQIIMSLLFDYENLKLS